MIKDYNISQMKKDFLEKVQKRQRQKPAYYGVLPSEVRLSEELTAQDKLIFCEILALSQKDGYCYATDGYIAWLYGMSRGRINKIINKLEKLNYIKILRFWDKNKKYIVVRLIKCYISKYSKVPKGLKCERLDWFGRKKDKDKNDRNNNI